MTQLVKKDSSWRTLRRKAVVGASSLALVAGMGVALAPSAMAATAPTVTVTAPEQIANDATAATVKVEIKTGANDADALDNNTQYQLALKLPAGFNCTAGAAQGNVTITGPSEASSPSFTQAGAAPSCTYSATTANANNAIAKDTTRTFTFTVKVVGDIPAAFASQLFGDAEVSFGVIANGSGTAVVGTAATTIVKPSGPAFTATVPAPKFGSVYNFNIVSSMGFPPADPADVWAVVSTKNSAGTWAYEDRTADVTVGSGDNEKYYASLNDKDFNFTDSGVTPVIDSMTGFFLETVSGNVVYGTVKVTGYAGDDSPNAFSFTQRAVNTRGVSTGTLTVIVDNGYGPAAVGASEARPATLVGEAASAQFSLNVNFTDVASDSPFGDAINSLSSADPVVIQGFGDGTFGATQNVTRGEFAAFVFRTLKNVKAGDATVKYTCDATTPSQFKDVANNNVFCESVNYLASVGVINGTSATTFAPNAKVTRDQAVAFIYRLNSYVLGQQVGDAPVVDTAFTDVTKANIFSGDIAWGAANNIVNGRSATVFAPADNVLRQEAAAFIYRYGHGLAGVF